MTKSAQKTKLYNLKKYIDYCFPDKKVFQEELRERLHNNAPEDTKSEISKRHTYFKSKILTGAKAIGPKWQKRIESMFDMPTGALDFPPIKKKMVYVLVSCRGKDAQRLFYEITNNVKEWKVVDECALVAGSADLILRLHGTEDQISILLTEYLYQVKGVQIQGTNTLFSFHEFVWERYPMRDIPREPTPPYWHNVD